MKIREDWDSYLWQLATALFGVAALCVGLVVLVYQAIGWLRLGVWPAMTVEDGIRWWSGKPVEFKSDWLGVQKIVRLILDSSIVLGLWSIGFLVAVPFGRTLARYVLAILLLGAWAYAILG